MKCFSASEDATFLGREAGAQASTVWVLAVVETNDFRLLFWFLSPLGSQHRNLGVCRSPQL